MKNPKQQNPFLRDLFELDLHGALLPVGWPENAKKIKVSHGYYQSDLDIIDFPETLLEYLGNTKKLGEKGLEMANRISLPQTRPGGIDLAALPEGAVLRKL